MPRKIWRKLGWFKRKPRSFWQLKEGTFQEILSSGLKQDPVRMEYIMPKSYGMNMISMLPVVKIDGVVWVGLVPQGSPAAQLDREPGKQWGLPKEHVPKTLSSLDEALAFVHQRFEESYGIRITTLIPLGADYRTNPELTPEVVYPFVADVSELMLQSPLTWFSLEDLMRSQDKLLDGHLLLSLFRLNHAVAGR